MTFGVTSELVAFVKQQEGWVAKPYLCPAGFPTIAYGHRIPSLDTAPLSKEAGERLLMRDLEAFRDQVIVLSPGLLGGSERRCAAIVDFAFNCGPHRYKGSTLRKRVETQDWPEAAKEMRRWVYAAGKVFRALVGRRAVTAGWLEQG